MKIRTAVVGDAALLADLGHKTFSDTFSAFNTPENMEKYLSENFSLAKQMSEINDSGTVFFIAEQDGLAVGYAKLKKHSRSDGIAGQKPIELQRIYSIREYIGKGVGAALMQHSINEARSLGFDCIWLGVWEENIRAINFYQKWGFQKAGNYCFTLGEDIQNDITMELDLKDG